MAFPLIGMGLGALAGGLLGVLNASAQNAQIEEINAQKEREFNRQQAESKRILAEQRAEADKRTALNARLANLGGLGVSQLAEFARPQEQIIGAPTYTPQVNPLLSAVNTGLQGALAGASFQQSLGNNQILSGADDNLYAANQPQVPLRYLAPNFAQS